MTPENFLSDVRLILSLFQFAPIYIYLLLIIPKFSSILESKMVKNSKLAKNRSFEMPYSDNTSKMCNRSFMQPYKWIEIARINVESSHVIAVITSLMLSSKFPSQYFNFGHKISNYAIIFVISSKNYRSFEDSPKS